MAHALWERVHGVRTVHTGWGNYTAFGPRLDPHRKVLHSNIGSQKTARKWVSRDFLAVQIEYGLHSKMIAGWCNSFMNHRLPSHLILYM